MGGISANPYREYFFSIVNLFYNFLCSIESRREENIKLILKVIDLECLDE